MFLTLYRLIMKLSTVSMRDECSNTTVMGRISVQRVSPRIRDFWTENRKESHQCWPVNLLNHRTNGSLGLPKRELGGRGWSQNTMRPKETAINARLIGLCSFGSMYIQVEV
jgi:hypothetical protein